MRDAALPRGRWFAVVLGAVSGMLAGFFLSQLGLGGILGDVSLPTILLTSAAVGVLLQLVGRLKLVLVANAVLFGTFLLVAVTPIMSPAAGAWVRDDPLPANADAIVVLSANINSAGMLSDQGVSRLLTGLELFQRGIAPRLITTEISVRYGDATRTSTADAERLIKLAGARDAWTYVSGVHTTRDEAMQVAVQLGAGKTVVVVTSPLHTRRACATFEAVGLKVVCAPSREQEYATRQPRTAWDRLEAFRRYAYERFGMVKYRAAGWLSATTP